MRLSTLFFTLISCLFGLVKSFEFQIPIRQPEVTVEDELYSATQQWLQSEAQAMSCAKCISLLQMVKNLAYMSEGMFMATGVRICRRLSQVDTDVCIGVVKEQAPVFRKVIKTMTVSGREGHLLCASVLNSCPYPDIEPHNITFPKAKPDPLPEVYNKKASGRTFSVLHLSDWHVDPEYEPGTEAFCSKPLCCRPAYTDFTNITKPASIWGEYSCDTPITLLESMLQFIPQVAPELSFGILTGDIPPHEVWATLPVLKTQMIHDNSYSMLHRHFDSSDLVNAMLYPSVGNHEAAPTNMFPVKTSQIPIEEERKYLRLHWLYHSLAQSWRGWLTHDTALTIEEDSASYATRPRAGLKLISLNTNFCYNMNWWLYEHPMEKDPNGVLEWLITQLQDSEDRGERVWITGHIAPGDDSCFHDYSNYFHQIVERYSPHVITGQFYGHTHKDEYHVFYRDNNQTAENAISMAYVGPSITPFDYVNPGFRLYHVDAETFEVVDSITFIADLDQADTWITGPNWHVEYTARDAYNSSFAPLHDTTSPLTPAWWHNVSVSMEEDPDVMFDKYWKYRAKSSPYVSECDEECRASVICGIRAGKSEQRCDYDPDVLPGGINNKKRRPIEEPTCGLHLQGATTRYAKQYEQYQEQQQQQER
ncbi:Metallo-dependent phosphatase-like protein [Phascolomyces articulosus]|uniref:Sphingomyelin phosphodiesterase n=1 Tax=Phascolomyces articulosus TaxID=60185 RepID=A0AAD5K834_9FUNG|nr:Metallo-dependent phosphatase-like protein [Phascolomyces articulosus]